MNNQSFGLADALA